MAGAFERAVTFTAPAWPADNARQWTRLAEQAADAARSAGTSSGRFLDVVAHVRELLAQGAYGAVAERMGERQVVRAILTVWAGDEALACASMPALFPSARSHLLDQPSRISATVLAALFWRRFDRLDGAEPGMFATVGGTLYEVARRLLHDGGEAGGPLAAVAREPQYWITASAPAALARHVAQAGLSLDDCLREAGVAGIEGRFGVLARREYYLVQIAQVDHATDGHVFLADVSREPVKAAETGDDLSFGHALLAALCDKPTNRDPSAQWLGAITEIGGDPRHRETERWRRWWAPVPPHLTDRAARWMAGADLSVYLDALDEYARREGGDGLRRMLPARVTFLRGLYQSGLVRDVRLILGSEVRSGMRRRLGGLSVDAPLYTGPQAPTTAVVVLVCDGFTVVEGSHNFQLYLYAGEPVPMLVDSRRRMFDADDLKDTVPALHLRTHGQFRQVQYRHNEIWQPKAIEFLRNIGVVVDPRAVLSAADYERERVRNLPSHTRARTSSRTWWRNR